MVNGNVPSVLNNNPQQNIKLSELPIKYCTVTLSDVIARKKRLEASVFDVEAKQARAIIEHGKYPTIMIGGENGLADSYVGGRFKRIWVDKSDIAIFQPSSIVDIHPVPDGYISHKTQTNIDALRVHAGQVLMTCSGTIGNLSYVSKTLDNKVFSHDLLRINCKSPIDAGYLYTYLKSTIGNKILLTNSYGAVITHIEAEHLASVPIPNAPTCLKRRINDLIVNSYDLRDESNNLLDEATSMFIKELQLPNIDKFDVDLYKKNIDLNTFSIKLSNIKNRIDASYHIPIIDAIMTHLQKYAKEVISVADDRISRKVILPGRFKRIYVEKGYGRVFIGGKQLAELDPSNKKYLSTIHHGSRIENQLELQENMILITCSGTIGNVTLVGKHWNGWTANQHIIRIIPASNDIAGYLYIFLASDYGRTLITRYAYGSVVDEIDDNHVRQIPIPLLNNQDIQQKINELALSANAKRYEAYKLEQKALQIMEKEVIFAN